MDAATALAIVAAIDELRAEEGAAVTIACDNPDFNGQPDRAVDVCAPWTRWVDRRFGGDTLLAALEAAVRCKRYHEEHHPND